MQILEVGEHDSALEVGQHLAHVVVETPQALDRGVVDDGAVSDHPYLGATRDLAFGDERAGDRADFRCLEQLADLGLGLDLNARGMGLRMQRFSMLVDDGVVKNLNVEGPGKFEVSDGATMLKQLG